MKSSKEKRALIAGMIGCLLYVIGDFLFAATGKTQSTEFIGLIQKFLVFTDRGGKSSLETMLKRWYTALEKEYRSQTAG